MKNEFTIIPAQPNWFAIGNCAWEEIEPDSSVENWGEPIIAWRIDKEEVIAITTVSWWQYGHIGLSPSQWKNISQLDTPPLIVYRRPRGICSAFPRPPTESLRF